jgi:hypothetical protein
MPLRIYIAPQIGSGMMLSLDPSTWSDTTGPYRSLLNTFIDPANGDNFDEIDHPARRVSICTVEASAAVLTAIEADVRVTPVTYARAADRPALAAILAAPFSSYPLAWRNAARAKLEKWGIDTSDITGSDTMKTVLCRVIKMFSVAQVADGHGQANVKEFLKGNLDVQVSAIPVAQRNAIGDWLQSKGIDTAWITGTTTVRQVVNTLPGNFAALYGRNVMHRFAREDF